MGAEQSGMIDPGCMDASFGILSLGMRTALRGEMIVRHGTEKSLPHRRFFGGREMPCYSPEAKYDLKILIMLFADGTRLKTQHRRLDFPVALSAN